MLNNAFFFLSLSSLKLRTRGEPLIRNVSSRRESVNLVRYLFFQKINCRKWWLANARRPNTVAKSITGFLQFEYVLSMTCLAQNSSDDAFLFRANIFLIRSYCLVGPIPALPYRFWLSTYRHTLILVWFFTWTESRSSLVIIMHLRGKNYNVIIQYTLRLLLISV